MSSGSGWGQDVTLRPGWHRIGSAALHAILDPQTWGPIAATALLQIDDADREISDWAVEQAPLFGSPGNAENARHWTGAALDTLFYASLLATPSGDVPGVWGWNKVRGGLVEFAGLGLANVSVAPLKDFTGRTRPNRENDKSFPSSHATRSSSDVTLAARNMDAMELPAAASTALKTGVYSLGMISAWSRVEAAGHYPSDVLTGWALGHFWTAFIHDAFLYSEDPPFMVAVMPEPGGTQVRLAWCF